MYLKIFQNKNIYRKLLAFITWIFIIYCLVINVALADNITLKNSNNNTLIKNKIDYIKTRTALVDSNSIYSFDSEITLNEKEQKLNDYLLKLREKMLQEYKKAGIFPPKEKFSNVKNHIESTELFAIIKKMPKGALLHVHRSAAGSSKWIIENATYQPDCYIFWDDNESKNIKGEIGFFKPETTPEGFIKASKLRETNPNLDQELYKLITIGPEDSSKLDIWLEFSKCFKRISIMMHYKPFYMDYLNDAFERLAKDNIQYVEVRTGIGSLYDFTEKTWKDEDIIKLLLEIRHNIKKKYPEFDFKLILAGHRNYTLEELAEDLKLTKKLMKKYPDFIIGYDLVGEEDKYHSTIYYLDELIKETEIPYYFHAGESDSIHNQNIFDAYLLNSRRIGHGFNLFYFPDLETVLKQKGIAIESCPISNQILDYIKDLRLHPLRGYLKRGIPCVLSSDDPAIFGNEGLTYDFWEVFMAWDLDLKGLKKLAINSIKYSGMSENEKNKALSIWQHKWENFVESSINLQQD